MLLTDPIPYREALDSRAIRSLLPTTGRTADFARVETAIKQRAMFSATVTSVELLQKYDDVIEGMLAGKLDQATARLAVKDLLAEMGYVADPNHAGGLQDLASTRRIDTTLSTNVDIARGYGWREQGMTADVLDEFPAQELFRAFGPRDASAQRDWAARWAAAGGVFHGGRMIALKTDSVWRQLGNPALFPDGLGNDFPPFAFNSGMDVRDIDRAEAIALGLLAEGDVLTPEPIDLNAELAATPEVRSAWLREALTDSGVGRYDRDGVFRFAPISA